MNNAINRVMPVPQDDAATLRSKAMLCMMQSGFDGFKAGYIVDCIIGAAVREVLDAIAAGNALAEDRHG